MVVYEEAVQEIEDAYEAKRDAVADKYEDRRIGLHQRDAKKKWPKRGVGALGGAGGAAAAIETGFVPLAGTIIPIFGGPAALAVGAAAGGAAGYILGGKGTDKVINGYNRTLNGAERVEKGWYNTREGVAKGTVKATSWASIDRLLGDSDDA